MFIKISKMLVLNTFGTFFNRNSMKSAVLLLYFFFIKIKSLKILSKRIALRKVIDLEGLLFLPLQINKFCNS